MLREERGRDQLQLQYIEEAKLLADRESPTTEPALKITESKVFEVMNKAATVRSQFSLLEIAKNMVVSSHLDEFKPRTILQWLHDFKELGGFFKRDARGVHEREWILSEEDLKLELLGWLKAEKRVTAKSTCRYINDVVISREGGKEKLAEYHLSHPISESTVHSWMTKLGCTYERHSQSYYTDGHERPDVVESRVEYIQQKREHALRQSLWVRVFKSSLSPQELARFDELKETGDEAFYAEVYDCEIDGKACIEFHADFLRDDGCVEQFDKLREALGPEDGHRSVRFAEAAAAACKAHHSPDKCKCHLIVYHIGQDERVYKAYAREGNEWVIQGVRGLRKKTEGPGEMVSAFQDEKGGFGLFLSKEELARVNLFRRAQGRKDLETSPGLRFLVFGKNKGGFGGFDEFEQQTVDVMDVLEVIAPERQAVIEVDHSAGHAKMREDGLHIPNMNVKYGGKQKMLRESTMVEGCLGPGEAKMYLASGKWSTVSSEGAVEVDLKLKVGDTQIVSFASGAPPPFYDCDAPPRDQVVGTKHKRKRKSGKGGGADGLQDGHGEGATSGAGEMEDRIKEGYTGKSKGIKQVLWGRGLWVDGMGTGEKVEPQKNIATVLSKLSDFRNERTALQHTVESRGHIILLSPKCHPEVAGVGIEYSWGMSKQKYWREINDEVPRNLHANILKSMCPEKILTLGRVRRFARRTRDFCRTYREMAQIKAAGGELPEGKEGIERM